MRLKVAVVAYSAPPYSAGGVASAHYNLFRMLQRAGVEAKFFTFGDRYPSTTDIVRRGTPPWLVSLVLKISGLVFRLFEPEKQAYQLADILKSVWGAIAMGREIARYAPSVVIVSDHGAPGLFIKKPESTRLVLVSHHNPARFVEHPELNMSRLDAKLALSIEQQVLRKVDAVVCPSQYMKDWFERTYRFKGVVKVIPNLLDEAYIESVGAFELRAFLNSSIEMPIIYLPSAGGKLKGGNLLIAFIQQLFSRVGRPIGFYVPGSIESSIINRAQQLPEEATLFFTGQVSNEENIANLKSCSFGISPSLMENYSMALLEAVHCGVPMVAFKTGGNADILADGRNGFLVDEGDLAGLVEKAISLLEANAMSTLAVETKSYALEHLSSHRALDAYMDLLKQI